jgi:alkanesulfonate monooxygenase SsuD/methylene tetrahydromethanopterin reductase-like flavin-dependent oxidoreductase (luciferase family)
MRTGLLSFCNHACRGLSAEAAFAEHAESIQQAELLGFDEAWIGEPPDGRAEASFERFSILSGLATRTTRIRLGALGLASPCRDPIEAANHLARLDVLSGGRLDFAIGKTPSIALQCRHLTFPPGGTGARTLETLNLLQRLFSEESVTFSGRFTRVDRVRLEQRPIQAPIPAYIASLDLNAVRYAARHDCGLMAEPLVPLGELATVMRLFRELSPDRSRDLVATRFFHIGATHDQAVEEAANRLAPRFERALAKTAPAQQIRAAWLKLGRLIAGSLIGTVDEIRAKLHDLECEVAPNSVVLAPVSGDFAKRKADLLLFAREIRPAVAAAA